MIINKQFVKLSIITKKNFVQARRLTYGNRFKFIDYILIVCRIDQKVKTICLFDFHTTNYSR